MTSVRSKLPTPEQLRENARKGRLVDRVKTYLPDSLYRTRAKKPIESASNGHANAVPQPEQTSRITDTETKAVAPAN